MRKHSSPFLYWGATEAEDRDFKEIVLALLQQCKDAGLTVNQTKFVLHATEKQIDRTVNDLPVVF